jgi:hypothetical protein
MLDSARTHGQALRQPKVLMAGLRFLGIEDRPALRKCGPLMRGTSAIALQ